MVQSADIVFRDFVTDGVPSSGANKPKKSEIRALFAGIDASLTAFQAGGGIVFQTKAAMTLTYSANQMAWVIADPVAANNGIYQKVGASGSGSWTRVGDLPYSFAHMLDVGAGTPNAIQVTSLIPTSSAVLRVSNVFVANTGNVTISENEATAKPLLTASGNQIASGGLVAGVIIAYLDDGTNFRLLSDQASAAIQAAAEAAQAAAEEARDEAVAAAVVASGVMTTVLDPQFATKSTAEAFSPAAAPDYIRTAGYGAAGDGGGALYKNNGTATGDLAITLSDGMTVVGYDLADKFRTFEMYGAVGDDDNAGGGTDDTVALSKALASGLVVWGKLGRTYRCVDETPMADHTCLNLLGARINYYGEGTFCMTPGNHCKVENGTIKQYGTTAVAGDRQCPIVMGKLTPVSVHDVVIRNMTIESAWDQGNGIYVIAASHDITIENIRSDEAGMYTLVGAEWCGSSAGTFHPHNITFRNIEVGLMKATSRLTSAVVWISAAYNILIENVHAKSCGKLIHIYCGDYGVDYAPAGEVQLIGKNNVVNNVSAADCWDAISISGEPFIAGHERVDVGARVTGVIALSSHGAAGTSVGIRLTGGAGTSVLGGQLQGFSVGVICDGAQGAATKLHVSDVLFFATYSNSVYAALSAFPPTDWLIENCEMAFSNQGNTAGVFGSDVFIGVGANHIVCRNNKIRSASATFGFQVQTGALNTVLRDNQVTALLAGGIAYAIHAATKGGGNIAASGITVNTDLPISDCLVGFVTVDLASIAGQASLSQVVTCTGAALGDFVEAVSSSVTLTGLSITGQVSGVNTVTLWFYNNNTATAVDLGSATFTVLVRKRA